MEEFFLRGVMSGDELNIVHHQHVHVAKTVAELGVLVLLDGRNQLVGKVFAADIQKLLIRVILADAMADRVHQMRFAQTHAAVDEQRVIRLCRRLGDGQRGRARKAVGVAHDEGIEGILRVERKARRDGIVRAREERLRFLRRYKFHAQRPSRGLRDGAGNEHGIAHQDMLLDKIARRIDIQRVAPQLQNVQRGNPRIEGRFAHFVPQEALRLFPDCGFIHNRENPLRICEH